MNYPEIFPFTEDILSIILLDRTTGKNILWATDDYTPISSKSQIRLSQITGSHSNRIKPRIQKQKEEQQNRTRNKAEVFTPSWICNAQNNLIDEAWFGRKDVFNSVEIVDGRVNEKKWKSRKIKIKFSTDIESHKTWQDYVKLTRLEITCGEAPYLVSRYDTVTGKTIKLKERIGLLDRKMRVICENAANEAEFFLWATVAFQNIYGFELQGDNLLLARTNLLLSFNEYTKYFLKRSPTEEEQKKIAEIISWNLWQMDGLTFSTPFSFPEDEHPSLFEEFNRQENFWKKGNGKMEFDAIVGNPPYQEMDGGGMASAVPVYQYFVENAMKSKPNFVSMIMPSRWFSGGRGLDKFRDKMIKDKRLRCINDFLDARDCFPNVEIKGGICYFLWDKNYQDDCIVSTYGSDKSVMKRPLQENDCKIFIRYNGGVEILRKTRKISQKTFLNLVSSQKPFGLRTYVHGKNKSFEGSIKLYENKKIGFISENEVLCNKTWVNKYKVYITAAYGAGEGFPHQILNKPIFGEKKSCCTETYMVIGPFESETETKNVISYIRTKYFRFMVLLIKNTQHAPASVYQFVPLQDFTPNSDIDWSKSIPEIDAQLYKKYGLSEDEIAFIEKMIRPMP